MSSKFLLFVLPTLGATMLAVFFCSPAIAAGKVQVAGSASVGKAIAATYKASRKANVQLSPLVVVGHRRVPLPVALQVIKKGLTRPWTNDRNDTRIRCRLEPQAGSHFRKLHCEGNRHHVIRTNRLRTQLATAVNGAGGSIQAENVAFTKDINTSAVMGLLNKMPPADASYTFRVTDDNGKPVMAYVIKNGDLVHIYHYVYKNKHPGDD